jgi:hypothetical protein
VVGFLALEADVIGVVILLAFLTAWHNSTAWLVVGVN